MPRQVPRPVAQHSRRPGILQPPRSGTRPDLFTILTLVREEANIDGGRQLESADKRSMQEKKIRVNWLPAESDSHDAGSAVAATPLKPTRSHEVGQLFRLAHHLRVDLLTSCPSGRGYPRRLPSLHIAYERRYAFEYPPSSVFRRDQGREGGSRGAIWSIARSLGAVAVRPRPTHVRRTQVEASRCRADHRVPQARVAAPQAQGHSAGREADPRVPSSDHRPAGTRRRPRQDSCAALFPYLPPVVHLLLGNAPGGQLLSFATAAITWPLFFRLSL